MAQYSKKQLDPIIKKYGINPFNDATFNRIIEMFDGQTPYHIWAIKVIYGKVTNIENISRLKTFSDENQALISKLEKKNLISYVTKEDFKQLNDEISGLLDIAFIKRSIENFNTNQRNLLKNEILKNKGTNTEVSALYAARSPKFREYAKLFKKFETLNESKKHKLIVSASAVNDDVNFLIKMISDSLLSSYEWNKEDLLGFIKRNDNCKDVKVVFNQGNIVVLEIPNFEASKTICGNGRTTWCITREQSYFNQYAGKSDCKQFFYFDFSKPERNELAHVGFTVNMTKGITYAHSTNNNNMCGQGITYDGSKINIDQVLKNANIEKSVFIHLNGLKNFSWDANSIVDFIAKNNNELAICCTINNCIIVRILSHIGFEKLCSHTFLKSSSFLYDKNNCVYTVLNLNVDSNNEHCMTLMQFSKDKYGVLSMTSMNDAYGVNITSSNYLKSLKISTSMFVNRENIKPDILLHKYIDEDDEKEAIKLIRDNYDTIDINFIFNENSPIFSSMEKKMFNLFETIVNHNKFKSDSVNEFGEPLLQALIYSYRCDISETGKENEPTRHMIELILKSDNYNFNSLGLNMDSPIMVAAERVCTNWILDRLISKGSVNVNLVNDFNCSALGNAMRLNNQHAFEMLSKRPDIVITDYDKEIASNYGFDLTPILKNKDYSTTIVESDNKPSVDVKEYAKIFASTFASRK